jgi:hypothetical protein
MFFELSSPPNQNFDAGDRKAFYPVHFRSALAGRKIQSSQAGKLLQSSGVRALSSTRYSPFSDKNSSEIHFSVIKA